MQSLEMTEKASKQAEAVKQEILQSGKKEVELIFHQAKAQIELEKQKMLKDVEREVARLIVMGAAKILEKEFSDADQKRLMESAVSSFRK
jgi:F-type H+-transporting ATPase subunit b